MKAKIHAPKNAFAAFSIALSNTPSLRSLSAIAFFLSYPCGFMQDANAAVSQYYWKDFANNGNWDWGGGQWYSSASSGNVGAPDYTGGAQLYFENNGNTSTTINSAGSGGGAPSGWIALNAIFTQNASSGKVYTIDSGSGVNGIYLYNKIETQNVGTAAGLTINSAIRLGSSSIEINAVAADIQLGALDLNGNTLKSYGNQNLRITGAISGTGSYNIQNTGITVTYSGSAANTFTGTTTVKNTSTLILNKSASTAAIAGFLTIDSGATVRTDAVNQLNDQLVTVNGTLNLNDKSQSTALAGSGSVSLGSGTLTINNTATDTFSGGVSGTGGVIKTGVGTQIFSSSNSYTGGTTVSAGTLELSHNSAAGTTGVAVSGTSAATLKIDSGITIANNITFSNTNASSNVVRALAAVGGGAAADYTVGTSGDLKSNFSGGQADTTAKILAGTNAGTAENLTLSFSGSSAATNDNVRKSDVFTIANSGTFDNFVLQLTADGLTSGSVLGWLDGGNQWVNAGTNFILGAYNNSLTLGNYGFDTTTNSAWAVVDHGGSFAVVPEPTSALAGVLLSAGLLRRKRRNRC